MIAIKKRFLFSLFGIMTAALPMLAADFTVGNLNYSTANSDDGTCIVKSPTATTITSVSIPAYVTDGSHTYTVTEIGKGAFDGCTKLSILTLPSSLKTIQAQAFRNCKALKSVVLPPPVETVSSEAFCGCGSLTKVYMGMNVSTIGGNAFAGTKLTDVYITTQKPPVIQSNTFPTTAIAVHVQGDEALSLFSNANHWKALGNTEKMGTPTAISTYNGVNIFSSTPATAGMGANVSRTYFRLPGESLTFTTSLTGNPDQGEVFWTSSDPDKVIVERQGNNGKLTVKSMSDKPVVITGQSIYANGPKVVLTINDCTKVGDFYYRVTSNTENSCTLLGPTSRDVVNADIPASVVINGTTYTVASVAELAFFQCKKLNKVTFPETITSVGYKSFCQSTLTSINLPTSIITIGGDAFKESNLKTIVIPNSVTSLGSYCFERCKELESVTLGNSMTSILTNTFSECPKLTSIILPPAIKTVATNAFSNCTSLSSIYLGPNITSIADNAFLNSTGISDIFITSQSAPSLGANSFPASVFSNAKLHLQGDATKAVYKAKSNWNKFADENVSVISTPVSMSTYNRINIFDNKPLTALAGQTATSSLLLAAGQTATYYTSLTAPEGQGLDQTKIFWSSSDYGNVYVNSEGSVVVKQIPQEPVTLTAVSIYANTPTIEITFTTGYENEKGEGNNDFYYSVRDEEEATCWLVAPKDASLTTANVPDKVSLKGKEYRVTGIANMAFYNCTNLSEIILPETIKTLSYKSLSNTAIESISLPTSLQTIGGDAFKDTPIKTIVIPNSVTSIGSWAFYRCRNLTSVILPDGLKSLESYTFQYCNELETIVLPPTITVIRDYSFANCPKLKTIYMGPNVSQISANAFLNSENLTDIYITAQSAPKIEASTFPEKAYANVTLHLQGDGTESIYRKNTIWNKFTKEAKLLTPPTEMKTYNYVNIFPASPLTASTAEGAKLMATTNILLSAGKSAPYTTTLTHNTEGMTDAEKLVLNKVYWRTTSSDNVYVNNNGLVSIKNVPNTTVKVYAETMFANSPSIEISVNGALSVEGQDLFYTITDEEKATCAVASPVNNNLTTVTIPDVVNINGKQYTVTSISSLAFYNCEKLTTVNLPQTMVSFGYRAFYGTAIEAIDLPSSLTSIGGDAFKQTKLKSIVIPNSVTAIGSYAFDRCSELKSITLSNKITVINGYTFLLCKNLESIVIPPSVKTIEPHAFAGCPTLKKVYMGPNITAIKSNAFGNVTDGGKTYSTNALSDVYITAQSVPTLSNDAFLSSIFGKATLHLQPKFVESNETIVDEYSKNDVWSKFKTENTPFVLMSAPSGLESYNGDNVHTSNPLKAAFNKTVTHSFLLKQNGNVTYTTTLKAPENSPLDQSKMFWSSSSPAKVDVDHNGKITNKTALDSPVTITAESIYAGSPKLVITIDGCSLSEEGDDDLYYVVTSEKDRKCAVAGSDAKREEIKIPEKVILNSKEYKVTSIGDMAFYQNKTLKKIDIPNTVTDIGYRSFYGSGLEGELILPNSVDSIRGASFEYTNITKAVLPNSIRYMAGYTFSNCKQLKEVQYSHHIPAVGQYNFQNCELLESIVLPPSIKSIGTNAFKGCKNLKSVYMGYGVSSIADNAFLNCANLRDLYITSPTAPTLNATAIPASLNELLTLHLQEDANGNLPDGYSKGNWAKITTARKSMPIPGKISTWNGSNLYSSSPLIADFGNTATHSFLLREGGSVKYNTTLAPADTDNPVDVDKIFWTSSNPSKVYVDYDGRISNSATLEDTETITGESIYAGGPKLVITITGCYPYTYENSTLYYRITDEENALCEVASSDPMEFAAIPENVIIGEKEYSVTGIGQLAFIDNKTLSGVSIPESVTSIGYRSFYGAGLTELNIPTSVTTIYGATFEKNPLKKVVIPNSVTNMGGYTFRGCTALEEVTLSHYLKSIGYFTFQGCKALKSIVIPPLVEKIDEQAFNGCSSLESVYIGPNVKSLGSSAFGGCTNLKNVYITSQKAPTLQSKTSEGKESANPFPATLPADATLYVQGETAKDSFKASPVWSVFKNEHCIIVPHKEMLLTIGSGDAENQSEVSEAPSRYRAITTTEDHIYGKTGDVHYRTATLVPQDDQEAVDIPNVFWTSSDPSKVYVDHNGTITLNEAPEAHKPVTVTAQSLYADAPTREIKVDNEVMTGIEEIIFDEDNTDGDEAEGPARIYTISGIYVGSSINNLSPGIYIVSQGRKTVKITVR